MDQERVPVIMKLQEPIDPINVRFFGPDAIMFEANAFADSLQETLNLGLVQALESGMTFLQKSPIPQCGKSSHCRNGTYLPACPDCIP